MKVISQAGGITIAQDEASSVVFGMPKEALALGGAKYILSPEKYEGAIAFSTNNGLNIGDDC